MIFLNFFDFLRPFLYVLLHITVLLYYLLILCFKNIIIFLGLFKLFLQLWQVFIQKNILFFSIFNIISQRFYLSLLFWGKLFFLRQQRLELSNFLCLLHHILLFQLNILGMFFNLLMQFLFHLFLYFYFTFISSMLFSILDILI